MTEPDYFVYRMSSLPADCADISLLDEEEKVRYAKRGLPFLLERSLLKRELAKRLNAPAAGIRLRLSENGKPTVDGIHFNISHTGDWLCIAFHDRPLGVDIEQIRPRRNLAGLAERIMSPGQREAFLARSCPIDEFFACWCSAEALVKQAGSTIGHAKDFPFLYHSGRIECLKADMPQVRLFNPAEGIQGAIAYLSEE